MGSPGSGTKNELVPSVPLEALRNQSPSVRGGMYIDSIASSPTAEISLEESFINELKSKDIVPFDFQRPASGISTKTALKHTSSLRKPSPHSHTSKSVSDQLYSSTALNRLEPYDLHSSVFSGHDDRGHFRSVSGGQLSYTSSVKSSNAMALAASASNASNASNASSTTSGSFKSAGSSHTGRELQEAKARIAELERQLLARETGNTIDTSISEKRRTIAGLEAKGTVAKRELQLLADAISRKDNLASSKQELVSAFTTDLAGFKQSLQAEIEALILEREKLTESRDQLAAVVENLAKECAFLDERKMQTTYQVNQLHDMHIELAKQAMQKFGPMINKQPAKDEFLYEEPQAPHIIDASADDKKERVNGRWFWKRPTAAVAKGVKGFNKVFTQDQSHQFVSTGPYVDTHSLPLVEDDVSEIHTNEGVNEVNVAPGFAEINGSKPRNGWFNKTNPTEQGAVSADPVSLMGYDIERRVAYERTSVPLIVTRCIQEVEKRGMTYEGIYRKSGGRSQVSSIEEAFEKHSTSSDAHTLDDALSGDVAGITSALKQYLRHLPNPLISLEAYDDFVEASKQIPVNADTASEMVRAIVNTLPQAYKDCLSVVCTHLNKVSRQSDTNLMTTRNLAVVFAPTLVRHTNGEREMLDMAARNDGIQLLIDRHTFVFADVSADSKKSAFKDAASTGHAPTKSFSYTAPTRSPSMKKGSKGDATHAGHGTKPGTGASVSSSPSPDLSQAMQAMQATPAVPAVPALPTITASPFGITNPI